MQFAQRISPLQTNVFADMDEAKAKAIASGQEIIDLSLGSSDLPVAKPILDAIASALQDPTTHGYTLFHSTQPFREAVARSYRQKYHIPIDPETEVLPLIGCQEGTAHLPLTVLDPGDVALLCDPGYPSHAGGVHLAGGEIHWMPLREEGQFLPVFAEIPQEIVKRSRLMVLSYPHNPTTAIASLEFFQEAVMFCRDNNIILAHDFPYADFIFTGTPTPPSVLQADPEKTHSIEFFTFSKSYNMGGFRIAHAVGNAELIGALRRVKAVIDFNQYRGIMRGAIAALSTEQTLVKETVSIFQQRRDIFINALSEKGWSVPTPPGTLYIWGKLPPAWKGNSLQFCLQLVEQTGVALSPGSGFGQSGEGYVRFALVHPPEVLQVAVTRIAEFLGQIGRFQ
ncbi:MAG: LL-diaminopimelate aminotransferase [Cyanobacteria bacterium SBLK]|nr:LL-diaminopimelate aminotransferase [Cyanobacteria bacterium SBLK]